MKKRLTLKKTAMMAMLLAISIVINIVESQIQIINIPAAKLGLANIVALILLYAFGFWEAFFLTLMRVFLVSLLLPGRFLGPVFWMGLSGAFLAIITMGIAKKTKFFGIIGTSIIGALFHTLGQVIVGYFLIGEGLFAYLPIMAFLSVITGFIVGLIARLILKVTDNFSNFKPKNKTEKIAKNQQQINKITTGYKSLVTKVNKRSKN